MLPIRPGDRERQGAKRTQRAAFPARNAPMSAFTVAA
jgi:hypothetical protein